MNKFQTYFLITLSVVDCVVVGLAGWQLYSQPQALSSLNNLGQRVGQSVSKLDFASLPTVLRDSENSNQEADPGNIVLDIQTNQDVSQPDYVETGGAPLPIPKPVQFDLREQKNQ